MDILFARHGNTFGPGDKVVWVGRETDLPLVEKGLAQAEAAGQALVRAGLAPTVIFAASLRRTRTFAEIVAGIAGVEVQVDERLDEIDYGPLGGLSTEEIAALRPGAEDALERWGQDDVWPEMLGWTSRESDMIDAARSFAADCLAQDDSMRPLVVSSNGTTRFLARALLPEGVRPAHGGFKLGTGRLGMIRRDGAHSRLCFWDKKPEEFA
ncbi:MAG: histidine phosphatase family protein [Rhodospirillaceae bacterium]|nr:histidine phosphatase family protein [Rhodospirillaceae bacterium]